MTADNRWNTTSLSKAGLTVGAFLNSPLTVSVSEQVNTYWVEIPCTETMIPLDTEHSPVDTRSLQGARSVADAEVSSAHYTLDWLTGTMKPSGPEPEDWLETVGAFDNDPVYTQISEAGRRIRRDDGPA